MYRTDCVNEETAYIVKDYPYGGYRTECRFWLDYRKGFGYRLVTQTLNPKTAKWNKPKKGVYVDFAVLDIDETGFVRMKSLHMAKSADIEEFIKLIPEKKDELEGLLKKAKYYESLKWEIKESGEVRVV